MDVMLKLNRITLENTEKTHRMEDVSFHFPDTGFISIHGDDESLMLQLARLLAGLHKPCSGSMVYGEEVMEYFTPQEQCRYRSICTASLFCDFQLLEQRSVLDNIRMSYDEDEQELDNLLRQWGLYGKKEIWTLTIISEWCFYASCCATPVCLLFIRRALRFPQGNGEGCFRC